MLTKEHIVISTGLALLLFSNIALADNMITPWSCQESTCTCPSTQKPDQRPALLLSEVVIQRTLPQWTASCTYVDQYFQSPQILTGDKQGTHYYKPSSGTEANWANGGMPGSWSCTIPNNTPTEQRANYCQATIDNS